MISTTCDVRAFRFYVRFSSPDPNYMSEECRCCLKPIRPVVTRLQRAVWVFSLAPSYRSLAKLVCKGFGYVNSQAPRLWCGHFKHQRIGHKGPLVHENTFGGLFQSCPAPRRAALQIPEPNGFTSWRREHILQNKQKNQDAIVYPDLAAELQASIAAAATAWEGITAFKKAPPRSACCPFSLGLCRLLAVGWHPWPCSLLCQGVPFLCSIFVSVTPVLVLARRLTLCARRCFVHVCLSIVRPSCPSDRRTPYLDVHGV